MEAIKKTVHDMPKEPLIKLCFQSGWWTMVPKTQFESVFRSMHNLRCDLQPIEDEKTYVLHKDKRTTEDAWYVLLLWLGRRESLPSIAPSILVDCWMLGEKYEVPCFQDAAMIELLRQLEAANSILLLQDITHTYWWERQTELMELILEELIKSIYHYGRDPTDLGLDRLDYYKGATSALLRMHQKFLKDTDSFFNRFVKRDGISTARWEDFLVYDGIKKAWDRDQAGDPIVVAKRTSDQMEQE